ncbi:MAG: flagellar hook protein FlgE [Deltaproteobacteria bacterium]|nr:flagellar hook protein FlgE [Deltaproteobacteria bacterium]
MTVISSLYSGISGIVANGSALSVSGDNIANMNTPGFKTSTALFETAISQRIGEANVGLGSRLAGTSANFAQGAFANSTKPTDLAIQGKGFFVVKDSANNSYYTRAGSFTQDSSGNLVTGATGYALQGKLITTSGTTETVSGTLSSINLLGSNASSAPQETTDIAFSANLNSSTSVRTDSWSGASATTAANSSDFNISTTVYDSLGNSRAITTYFRHVAANKWTYHVTTPVSNLANGSGTSTATAVLQEGVIGFDTSGNFSSVTKATAAAPLTSLGIGAACTGSTFDLNGTLVAGEVINPALTSPNSDLQWASGAAAIASASGAIGVTFDFGQSGAATTSMTQYSASNSSVSNVSQDGRSQGSLQSIEITNAGILKGVFSNGSSRNLYEIQLSTFANEEGLTRVGSNLYTASASSGDAQVGAPSSSGRGQITSFAIEQSNVDLATEFVKIITFQRGFQASSRTVSTASELLQDLVRLGQ